MFFHALHPPVYSSFMPSSAKMTTTYSHRELFRSTFSDDILPQASRRSVDVRRGEEFGSNKRRLLTTALMESYPDAFTAATETSFLRSAGAGKVTKAQLSKWLSQDRLYAETYICFISSLIPRVNLPYCFVSDKSQSLRWRIIKLLTGALENIHRELEFFTTTAQKYGLDLEYTEHGDTDAFIPNHATQQYMDLFRSFSTDPSLPLIEGLVVLWATEQCYLSAWMYASRFLDSSSDGKDADGGALRNEFIPNWTSKEFKSFVDEIAEVTNLLAEREQAVKKLEVHKAVWSHVLDIEKHFWPEVD